MRSIASVLVNKQAPDFTATAVVNGTDFKEVSLSTTKVKYYYSLPSRLHICMSTELHAFQAKLGEFKERNTEVVAVSVDSHFSHSVVKHS